MEAHDCSKYFPEPYTLQDITHKLYHKYASSQNYYYTKELNEILAKVRTHSVVAYQDMQCFDDLDEYLKRYYHLDEYPQKIQLLTEFYKFHKDLPRWAISKDTLSILNYYYDKKRRIEFFRIQRQIEQENQLNPQHPPKGIVGDRPIDSDTTPQSETSEQSQPVNVENILKEISFSATKPTEISLIQRVSVLPTFQDKSRQSSEIQQMINLITLQNTPQMSPKKLTKKAEYKYIVKDDQYSMLKKKPMTKKPLRLDDLALSLSSRAHQNPQEAKMPLSARYQSYTYKLLDQMQLRLGQQKHSWTASREKIKESQHLLSECNSIRSRSKNKFDDKYRKSISNPKKPECRKSCHEIKQLEIKILKSLQELEKNKSTQRMTSLDSKSLQKILNRFAQNLTPRLNPVKHQKQVDSFTNMNQHLNNIKLMTPRQLTPKVAKNLKILIPHKSQENVSNLFKKTLSNRSGSQTNNCSLPIKQKMKALDLKRLMVQGIDKQCKTDRAKHIPTLNLNMIGVNNNQQSSFTSRNTSFNPINAYAQLLTPKPHTARYKSNTLMHWQVKAIQAASREYHLNIAK